MTEFIAVTDQRHPESKSSESPEKADDCSLSKKHPDDLRNVRPECFHDSDFTTLLHRHGDERAHDSERRDDHDEKQEEKHYSALEAHRFEKLAVHVDPRLRVLGRLENIFNRPFYALGAVRVIGSYRDAVQRVTQAV